jgi:DNA-binding MurR/RpiR family transcriptional regulator
MVRDSSPAARVLALFDGHRLTPAQRRIAQCLVEQAAGAAYLSSGELAARAQVSQPSVTRFAIAIGFDGYPALRRRVREVIGAAPPQRQPVEHNELQRAVAAEADNLGRLATALADRGPVHEAGKLFMTSRPLPVLGLRAAAPIAAYFGYFAAKIHPDVRLLDSGGSLAGDRLEQARHAGATTLFAIVLPRYPREALDVLADARAAGLTVVTLTDTPVSPAVADSDLVLPAAVGSSLVFDLHAAPMALATVLLQAMCDVMPAEAQQRLESFERTAARRQVFLP